MTDDPHFELGDLKVYLSDVDRIVEQKWKRGEGAFISFVTSNGNYVERFETEPKKAIQFLKQSFLLMAEISKRQGQL